jgi:putative redox protein
MTTDAPVDNHGRGESFSPTDLLGTALATCMATIMGIIAERHGVDLRGMRIEVDKEMVVAPVRRVGRLTSRIWMPISANHPQRTALEQCVRTCPVYASLHPDVEKVIEFFWQD